MSQLRSIARNVAKTNMKNEGLTRFCKHGHTGQPHERMYHQSNFAKAWRDFAVGRIKTKGRRKK